MPTAKSPVTRTAAGDLLALVDGKSNVTLWNFNMFGRATNKIDASGSTIFGYGHDANGRLTNRWTPAKWLLQQIEKNETLARIQCP